MSDNLSPIQLQLQSNESVDQIAALQHIASQSDVTGVVFRCLDLLDAPEEEVRNWAAEALTNSVVPTIADAPMLIAALESSDRSQTASISNDALYWAATMLARLPIQTHANAELLIDVADRCAQQDAPSVAERCLSLAQRILEPLDTHDWPVKTEQVLINIRDSGAASARLQRLATQLLSSYFGH